MRRVPRAILGTSSGRLRRASNEASRSRFARRQVSRNPATVRPSNVCALWSRNLESGPPSALASCAAATILLATFQAAASAVLAKKTSHRLGHSVIALAGLWSLIAALAFSGSALTWLVFADAIAVGVLGLVDLAVHEATTERIVHQLEVRDFSHAAA